MMQKEHTLVGGNVSHSSSLCNTMCVGLSNWPIIIIIIWEEAFSVPKHMHESPQPVEHLVFKE